MSNKQTQWSANYNAKTYEDIKIRVKKGEKDEIKKFAESKGLSLNGYITGLIHDDMKREK